MNDRVHDETSGTVIQQYMIVCKTPTWLIGSKNVAVATAVTDDGRVVEGVGSAYWSTDTAAERAVEHARSLAEEVPFSFRITRVKIGASNATFQRVNEGQFRKGGNSLGGINPISVSTKVWIHAENATHEVEATGKTYINISKVRRALRKAIDSAESQFNRVGDLTGQV
jgi:hypothetical protein